jgi:1-acyl-sn-glycerol-3-phosphate acyltransferase
MKVQVAGFQGPVAHATRAELHRRGHQVVDTDAEAVIFFPGKGPGSSSEDLARLLADPKVQRLVLRSHAYAYGSNPKNPGYMTENRLSLLPPAAEANRFLRLEEMAATHPNHAAIRLTTVASVAEGDPFAVKLAAGAAVRIAGRNPNMQLIDVEDAAAALAAAVDSDATGIFNAAGSGVIPLQKAFRAANTRQFCVPDKLSLAELQYNWTVSSDRAERELGWKPKHSTVETLMKFLADKSSAKPALLKKRYDDWGLDIDYIKAWGTWFEFLRRVYWRIEVEGMEHVPEQGRALFVSNHRGFMPLDAVMHLWLTFRNTGRIPRFLITHTLLRTPFMMNFLTKLGGVVASQENATRLFDQEALVAIFPEGIRGTFTPYKQTHRLRDFTKSGFAEMAVLNQAPILPSAVIGHAEIFPIIGRINSSWVVKELGWPYLPIAPLFPLAPIPLPSKWHVRMLPVVPLQGLKPADAANARLMKEFGRYIQNIVQKNIDEMVSKRKHFLWGKILDGKSVPAPAFTPRSQAAAREASV